ncbi:MAG: GIY-YIG nuclease family protein [Litorimonas sp.]
MIGLGFCTYIVASARYGTLYCGHTDDMLLRATQHRLGLVDGFARRYGCKHLVWFEEHGSRDEAFRRERRIKKWRRAWKVEMIEALNPRWLDIGLCPVWPMPDAGLFPGLHERCLGTAIPRA